MVEVRINRSNGCFVSIFASGVFFLKMAGKTIELVTFEILQTIAVGEGW